MPLINKRNYLPVVCVVFTLISLCKIVLEMLEGYSDPNYALNFLTIFVISLIATLVLGLHYYLQRFPLTVVILGQYLILLGVIMLSVWVSGHFQKLAPTAYSDLFWSFTLPYAIGAIVYYISFLLQIRRANLNLKKLQKDRNKQNEHSKENR